MMNRRVTSTLAMLSIFSSICGGGNPISKKDEIRAPKEKLKFMSNEELGLGHKKKKTSRSKRKHRY